MSNPRRLGEWSRRTVCPSCIDGATGRISVRYQFKAMKAVSWVDKAEPGRRSGKKRQ